jgi:hypothetical protein
MTANIPPLGHNPFWKNRKKRMFEEANAWNLKDDRNIRLQMLALVAFFSNFIFWFDDPELTGGQSIMLGVAFLIYLIYMVNHNILHVLYVFTIYISFQKVLAGDFGGRVPMLNLTNILLITIFFAWWAQSFLRGMKIYEFRVLDFFIVTYTMLLTVAMLRSEFRHNTGNFFAVVTNFKRITEVFLVYFMFYNNVKTRKQIKHILFCVCLVMAAVGVMGVKQYYMDIGGGTRSNMDYNKITILTDQPNQLASFLCNYSFYLLATFLAFWKKWWGLLAGIFFICCFQSLRVTFSRGGLLSFYMAFLVVLLIYLRVKFLILALPLVFVVTLYPAKVLGPRLYKNYVHMIEKRGQSVIDKKYVAAQSGEPAMDESAMSRLWIMEAGFNRIREDSVSSMFGVGLGRFPEEINGRHPRVGYIDAHNQWLLILVECGSIALITFWCILAICSYKALLICWRTKDILYRILAVGYLGGIAGLFLANFFGSRMNSNEITHFHWIMTAVLMRVDSLVKMEYFNRTSFLKQQALH